MRFYNNGSECGQKVFERRINLCKTIASLVNNPFLGVIFKNIGNSSNFAMNCPFPAGLYEIKDFAIVIPSELSTPLLMSATKGYCAEVRTSGVIDKQKVVNEFLYWGGKGHLVE